MQLAIFKIYLTSTGSLYTVYKNKTNSDSVIYSMSMCYKSQECIINKKGR